MLPGVRGEYRGAAESKKIYRESVVNALVQETFEAQKDNNDSGRQASQEKEREAVPEGQ